MNARGVSAVASLALVGGLLALASSAEAASLEGDYRFDDNLSSSLAGAPPLTTIGPAISLFETRVVNGADDRVLTFPEGNGVQLPAGVIDPAEYSVIATFELDDTDSYRRIIQFDTYDADSDAGFYNYSTELDFYSVAADEVEGPPGALANDVFADITFTRAADKTIHAYAGDAEQLTLIDGADEARIGIDGLRFFKDNSNTEESAGSVARIRVYDGVLTPAEIATIRATGGLPATGATMGKPRLLPKKARKAKRVDSAITVFCPSEGVSCALKGKLKRAKKQKGVPAVLGKLSGEVDAGGAARPKIKLSKKGRKAVKRKGRIKIKAEVTITPASGKSLLVGNGGKI